MSSSSKHSRQRAGAAAATLFVSPIGPIELWASDAGLRLADFVPAAATGSGQQAAGSRAGYGCLLPAAAGSVLEQAATELEEYFAGRRREFTVPLDLDGTPFQLRVWQALLQIPYGATTTYRDLAAAAGQPRAIRAAGAANGANPISIIVPCHRVVGSNGSLTGYGGGLPAKRYLIDLERKPLE